MHYYQDDQLRMFSVAFAILERRHSAPLLPRYEAIPARIPLLVCPNTSAAFRSALLRFTPMHLRPPSLISPLLSDS
jgi:hypothetical protein